MNPPQLSTKKVKADKIIGFDSKKIHIFSRKPTASAMPQNHPITVHAVVYIVGRWLAAAENKGYRQKKGGINKGPSIFEENMAAGPYKVHIKFET